MKPIDEMEETTERLMIPDESGKEEPFEILFDFETDEDPSRSYILVTPAEPENEDEPGEVYAFRYEEDGDHMTLYPIEDEDEWQMVEETFNTLMMDEDEEDAPQGG